MIQGHYLIAGGIMSVGSVAVESVGTSGAAKSFVEQLSTNVEKQPGWVPLLICYYVVLSRLAETSTLFGVSIRNNQELIVVILTLVSYQLGDAIDKPIFRQFDGSLLDRLLRFVVPSRDRARQKLGVRDGAYRVSKEVLAAAGAYEGSAVHLINESAKFLRSVPIPLIVLPMLPISILHWTLGVRVAIALTVFGAYLIMKPLHMRLLYIRVVKQMEMKPTLYSVCDLPNNVRLFFWDGKLATSASHVPSVATSPVSFVGADKGTPLSSTR